MVNLIRKLFKGSGKGCCDIKIEEVREESMNKDSSGTNETNKVSSCCKSGACIKKD